MKKLQDLLSERKLKVMSRVSFVAAIVLALGYVFTLNTRVNVFLMYGFFVIYGVFVFSTGIRDRRKRNEKRKNQSKLREIINTLFGALMIIGGLIGLMLAGALIFA